MQHYAEKGETLIINTLMPLLKEPRTIKGYPGRGRQCNDTINGFFRIKGHEKKSFHKDCEYLNNRIYGVLAGAPRSALMEGRGLGTTSSGTSSRNSRFHQSPKE